ncbi:aminotransferase class I/II-fold pyridoxal phosphate-dependent enzyme [Parvularcula bermudensis]
MVKAARAAGRDIIDLSMGSPDMQAAPQVIETLRERVYDEDASRYSDSRGILPLRQACADYYDQRFGVALNPDTQVVATLGSKNAFANLAFAITAPGDLICCPNPSYPIHMFGFVMAGGSVRHLPAEPSEEVFRAAERTIRFSVPKPIALILNYPSNPTTITAEIGFYEEAVRFAKKHDLFLLSDLAYAEVYEGTPPPSLLQVEGAMDISVEFTSASKSFNMAGWRMGFAVGNEDLIAALTRVKSYLDYGSFGPIQQACTVALQDWQSITDDVRAHYRSRRRALHKAAEEAGWHIPRSETTMFAWTPLPKGETDSLAFCRRMVAEAGVALSPGVGFGEGGEGHVRIALVADEARLAEAAQRVGRAL